jgi:DNA polymerase phi
LPAISTSDTRNYHFQATIDRLCANGLEKTPEGVAIWLSICHHDPKVTFPKSPWQYKNPLHQSNLTTLAKVLKETPPREEGDKKASDQKGSWNSKLHFAWNIVLSELYDSECATIKTAGPFNEFWRSVVDG